MVWWKLPAVTRSLDVFHLFMRVSKNKWNRKFCYRYKCEIEKDIALTGWYTKRGCIDTTTTSCTDPETCISCNGQNCNTNVFPEDRHKCLKCNNFDCLAAQPEYCDIYLKGVKDCVTMFDEGLNWHLSFSSFALVEQFTDGNVMLKSCYADIPDATREACDDSEFLDCKKCSGENCNTDTQREGTKCFECSGDDCPGTLVDCHSSCYVGMDGKSYGIEVWSDFKKSCLQLTATLFEVVQVTSQTHNTAQLTKNPLPNVSLVIVMDATRWFTHKPGDFSAIRATSTAIANFQIII